MAQTAELSTETVFFGGKARLVSCIQCTDERGTLLPFEFGEMPFEPRRSFIIKDTTAGTIRGGHGHQTATQMLICLQGRIEIVIQHGDEEVTLALEPGSHALIFGPGIWCKQEYLIGGSILLAFSDEPYDPFSYISNEI